MAMIPDMKPRYYLVTVDDDPRRCRLLDADGKELPMVGNIEWRSGGSGQIGRATVELMFVALGPPPLAAEEDASTPIGRRGAIPEGAQMNLGGTNLPPHLL